MGTAAAETVALRVESSANLAGIEAARAKLGDLGKTAASIQGNVNAQIGAFEALGKTVDTKSAAAVQGYRAQGDALSANLVRLGATDTEINRVGASIAKLERAAGASLLVPTSPQSTSLVALPARARTAANAMGVLSQAAVMSTGSISSMVTAVGSLSTGLSSLATSAKAVAAATWITLLIQAGTLVYGVVHGVKQQLKEFDQQLGDLASERKGILDTLGGDDLAAKLEQINRASDKQIAQAKEISFLYKGQREEIIGGINKNRERSIALATTQHRNEMAARAEERQAQINNGAIELRLEQDRADARKDDYQLSLQANEANRQQREAEIRRSFERRSASGAIIALNAQEIEQLNTLLQQNTDIAHAQGEQLRIARERSLQLQTAQALQGSDSLTERFRGRLEEIEIERQAAIKATGDVYTANVIAEEKKRALYRQTANVANESAKTFYQVLQSSHDKNLKAVSTFAENIRRVLIGADAARAAVKGFIEGAEAVASLAVGDFRGAALHGTAAAQFAAAAAVGFREAGGGGSGGGGGGGGGPSGTFAQTREREASGNVTVVLQVVDPNSRDAVAETSYQLQRAGVLNRPVYAPAARSTLGPTLVPG